VSKPQRTPPLVLLAVLAVLAGALATGWLVLKEARQQRVVHGALLAQKLTATSDGFRLLLRPFGRNLETLATWHADGLLTSLDAAGFRRLVQPLADPTAQVAAVYAVPDRGPALLLNRTDEGWRMTTSDSLAAAPWLAGAEDGGATWSDYGPLPGDGRTGLIAVRRSGHVVFGVAILEATLDGFVGTTALTENALLVRRFGDGTVAWLNSRAGNRLEVATPDDLLTAPVPEHATIGAALRTWGAFGRPYEASLEFRHGGERWWCVFYPAVAGTDPGELGLIVPDDDLARRLDASRNRITVLMSVVMVLALATMAGLAWTWRARWQRAQRRRVAVPADEAGLAALVARGEGDRLEFKSTMRFNLKAGKPGKEIELAWLKSVVGYLNTDGGVILLGVADDGTVLGLAADGFRNDDKLQLHFDNLIKQHVGLEFAGLISGELRTLDGHRIFVVACGRCDEPVFLRDGEDEHFFIRMGPSTRRLPPSRITDWTRERRP
jgi:hypothetical protein